MIFSLLAGVILSVGTSRAQATPEDDLVAQYLQSHNMTSLLKVQLQDRIERAKSSDEREALATQLSLIYLDELKNTRPDDPYRQMILIQAQTLIESMGQSSMYGLRIELIIYEYQSYESAVELHKIDLLDPEKRQQARRSFEDLRRRLKNLTNRLDIEVAKAEKASRKRSDDDTEAKAQRDRLADLRRYKSLAHYYAGWAGYSLSALNDTHIPADVFESFGWLLGGRGKQPTILDHQRSTFKYEHVARAAIGIALSYTQSGDLSNARDWLEYVIESPATAPDIVEHAQNKLIQILIEYRQWSLAHETVIEVYANRELNSMSVADARFIALYSLKGFEESTDSQAKNYTKLLAKLAINQLLERGEIGHVLDLYARFDSIPILSNSFVSLYAQGLKELNRVESHEVSTGYSSSANLFSRALKADDAKDYLAQRNDCKLKLAYCLIQSANPEQAAKICQQVIHETGDDQTIEEARWIRIAALESAHAPQNRIDQAVREYLFAYPSTTKSAKLILRYALRGTVDSSIAIETLESINDDDQLAVVARRMLVKIEYEHLRSTQFADQSLIAKTLDQINWIRTQEPETIEDINDANARMNLARIALDLALRQDPFDQPRAQDLLEYGVSLLAFDSSFEPYRAEFLYRQLEIAIKSNRLDSVDTLLSQLNVIDEAKAKNARLLLFQHALESWDQLQSTHHAQRVVSLGVRVLAEQSPKPPSPLRLQISGTAQRVAICAAYLHSNSNQPDMLDLASRLLSLVMDRGQPNEIGLRLATKVFQQTNESDSELKAWNLLLGAYPTTDPLWYEARYETLRLMKDRDFQAALKAYDQFRLLHPSLGPSPWNQQIAALFGDSPPQSPDGEAP